MAILMRMNRNRVIRGIARNCSPYLSTGYGVQPFYTPAQIETAMQETKCNVEHIDYAYVMFGKEEDVEQLCCDEYASVNCEIAESCFQGDEGFSVKDVFSYSSQIDFSSWNTDLDDIGGGDGD